MCRPYSAETEEALRKLTEHDTLDEPTRFHANAERAVLRSLANDPYQLPCVRRAIQFYLRYHGKLPMADEATAREQNEEPALTYAEVAKEVSRQLKFLLENYQTVRPE
jgi:hypothetical protein